MEINNLKSGLEKIAGQTCQTLNLEEQLKIRICLLDLQSAQNFEEVKFFGKITGIERDYYIAIGLTYSGQWEFPKKQ